MQDRKPLYVQLLDMVSGGRQETEEERYLRSLGSGQMGNGGMPEVVAPRPQPVDAGYVSQQPTPINTQTAQQAMAALGESRGSMGYGEMTPTDDLYQNVLRASDGSVVRSGDGSPVRTGLPEEIDPEKAAIYAQQNPEAAQEVLGGKGKQAADMINQLSGKGDAEDSWFTGFSEGVSNFFGNKENMLGLALAFNSLRFQPDQGLTAVLGKQLETRQTLRQQNKTAMQLLQSANPQMKKVGQLMAYGGLTYKEALAASKQSDFDKKLALIGGDVTRWKDTYGGAGTTVTIGGEGSKGWEQIDKDFGQVWIDWNKGGADAAYKNIGSLKTVLNALEGGEQLTGTIIGLTPDVALKVFNPESVDARQRVENVVQQSMKEILGAQFTEKEGERLIARSYDPALSPAQNASRLKALVMMLEGAAAAKEEMVKHFGAKGTLAGFERTSMPTALDFEMAMDNAAPLTKERRDSLAKPQNAPPIGTVVDDYRFIGGDPSKEANWVYIGQ